MTHDPDRKSFDEALTEHRRFRRLSEELRGFLENPRPEIGSGEESLWASQFCHHVVSLHASVSRHFLVEEIGLLREFHAKFPFAKPRLEESAREHGAILAGIREIVSDAMSYAEAQPPEDPNLRQRARKLLDEIESHEARVTGLVQDLALTDIGTGD